MTKQMSETLTLETTQHPPRTFPGWSLTLSRRWSALCKLSINVMPIDWKTAQRSFPASALAGAASPELPFWGFFVLREQ